MRKLLPTFIVAAMAAGAIAVTGAAAQTEGCDYMAGDGWFNTTAQQTHPLAKANFVFEGGCKYGSPTWGHLEYADDGNGLNLTSTSITAYIWDGNDALAVLNGRPIGARILCGTAMTNLFGDVNFGLVVFDAGEPGTDDAVIIRLRQAGMTVYSTENPQEDFTLGGTGKGGGNIQIFPATSGSFTAEPLGDSCPAFF